MNLTGLKLVSLRRLRLPGDFLKRMREPRVGGLAEKIRDHGMLTPVLMRKTNGDVLDGLDRIAACFLLKLTHAPAILVECTDLEAEIIRREANAQRRHDPEEKRQMSQELIDKYTEEEALKERVTPRPIKVGRPTSPRGKAIARVARDLGVSEVALKKRQQRAKKAVGEALEPPLNLIGMIVPDSAREGIMAALGLLREAATKASQCLALLTQIETGGYPFPAARLQRLRSDAAELAACIRNAKPVALCPYCKGVETLLSGCSGCAATGWILSNQESGVPQELWDDKDPKVFVGAQARSVWDYLPSNELPEADPFGDES